MYLKHLKITGFKSFGREVIFTFDKNLNIIVGPNGSGKSNIIDAVKWLLGEAKYKSIRLEHPDSVLFNGNDTLSAAKLAKVEMIIDNTDEEIIEFGKEFSIMRTYKKGDSRYYIDGKRVNLKDIKSFISDKGLGKEFYSIISQGKITELVKSGGKSMKNLLDQAAGITPFYQKKDEALRNLEQTEQNLLRIGDIIKEISSRKNSLHLQAKRAEKYLSYRSLLNNYKATKLTKQLEELSTKITAADDKIEKISAHLNDKKDLLNENNKKLEEYRQKYSRIDKIMKDLTSAIDSLREKEERFNDKLAAINKALNDKILQKDNLKYQISSNEEKILSLNEKVNVIESELKKLSKELEKAEEIYIAAEQERKRITEEVDFIQKKNFNIQEEIFNLKSQLSELKSGFETRDRKLKSIDDDIESVKNEIKNNEYKIEQSKTKMKDYFAKLEQYKDLDKKLKKKIQEKEVLLHNLKHTFEDINSQLNKLNLSLSSLNEKYSMNKRWMDSYEGYSKAVKVLFRELKRNSNLKVIDTVANIIKPKEGYEMAINALISGRLQNVITESSEDAKNAIEVLKRYKAGRITFLPMDLIKGNLYSSVKPREAVDFARNLVEYDETYKNIIDFIFTNSIVTETIDMAIKIKKSGFKGKIATIEGEVIQPGGAITGGSTDEHSLNLINRQKILDELNDEILSVQKEMDKKTLELSRISIKMNETIDEIKDLKGQGNEYQTNYDRLQNQINLYSDMISSYEENIEKFKKKLQSLEKMKPDLKNELDDLNSKLSYIDSLIKEKEKMREEIKSEMNDITQEYKKIDLDVANKRQQYENIKNKYESKSTFLENLKKDISTSQEVITEAKIELKTLNKEIDLLKDDVFYAKKDIEKIKKTITSKIDEMKSNSELKSKGAELLQSLREKTNDLENEVEKLRDSLREEELNKKEYQVKLEDVKILLDDIQYDTIYKDKSVKDIDEAIVDLENKLKHIGSVNLNAFDEYKEVLKRYEEYEKQRQDIVAAKEKIHELIRKLDEEARAKFIESLKNIQIHFDDMMDILFNGGSGEIVLTNPEDVLQTEVDITVKVPHKKIKSLYAMSGGEQTLIGVALMFAFLKTNPSPFYILDEIDANLDAANTERISNLLKNLSQNTQFIVITHNKIMMDIAKTIYGITMEKGLTKAIRVSVE